MRKNCSPTNDTNNVEVFDKYLEMKGLMQLFTGNNLTFQLESSSNDP
ncbi:hypothetical protein N9529_06350 [Crocinitomicaceae bacterium]|nr:hypothetical protein [Crocinitomicaceae bacterium]MDB4075965.1 hypothetical protein [Crocinitomicaceae bacterium]